MFHREVILLILYCPLFENLWDNHCKLLWLLHVVAHLLLHESTNMLPLAQGQIVVEGEFRYQWFYAYAEGGKFHLAQVTVFYEAAA